jgi:hypothetical protein
VQSIRAGFDAFEREGLKGIRARKAVRDVRAEVWRAWRRARRADVEQWTANNFFKSKWGHKKVLSLAMPKVRRAMRTLAAECVT